MGALPKRRISKARKGNRRAHNALAVPALSVCPKCGKAKRPHFKCAYCGFYGEYTRKATTEKAVKPEAKATVAKTAKAAKPVKAEKKAE